MGAEECLLDKIRSPELGLQPGLQFRIRHQEQVIAKGLQCPPERLESPLRAASIHETIPLTSLYFASPPRAMIPFILHVGESSLMQAGRDYQCHESWLSTSPNASAGDFRRKLSERHTVLRETVPGEDEASRDVDQRFHLRRPEFDPEGLGVN